MKRFITAAAGLSLVLLEAPALAGQEIRSTGDIRPVASVTRAASVPVIDGELQDEAWRDASPITAFYQREPVEGQPVSERTEVRILADEEALYIGAWLYDRDVAGINQGERVRDANLENGDYFGVILDTYRDRQNGFIFSTTPAGIEYDGQVVKEGQGGGVFQRGQNRQQAGAMGGFNLNWDASWEVAASQDEEGWYAEMRIPFSTLRYGSGSVQRWGMNLVRRIRRRNEEAFWSPVPRQFNLMRLSVAGDLTDVPVPSRRAATVTPYALGAAERDYTASTVDTEYPGEFGVDSKITLTPALTLDLTYNTDFAQVEVDEQRTNLTRFPLFFPEKRPFFLENAGIFSAGTPQAADLFFTRRIGISDRGTPVPILGGGRLSGRAGGLNIGVLQLFTDEIAGEMAENAFSVARVSRELPNRSRAGAIFVQRRATHDGDDFNRTYAVDGRIGVGDALTFDLWAAKTETPELDGRDAGYNVLSTFESRDLQMRFRYMQIGEDFNPEVGFVNRVGYRHLEANVMPIIRVPSISWWRQSTPHVTYRGHWGFDGFYESGFLHFDAEIGFENGGRFGPELNIVHEGLRDPFEVAPGVVIPAGSYDNYVNSWDIATDPSARLSYSSRMDFGGFFSGHRYGGNGTMTFRPSEAVTTSLLVDHNIVRMPEGDFETTLLGLRLAYFFTPRIFLQSLIQYSDQADVWSANVRFAILDTAGTGLYVVYNGAQQADRLTRWQDPISRGLIIKYARQLQIF